MAINVKSVAQKYNLSVNEIEALFYSALNGAKNIGGKNPSEDLVSKFFIDLLEESGIPFNLAEKISDYYVYDIQKQNESYKSDITKKILESNKEPIDLVKEEVELNQEDEIQTSGQINQTLGMSKKNPKYVHQNIYTTSNQ